MPMDIMRVSDNWQLCKFGQSTSSVYRIQWYPTSELLALVKGFNAERIGCPAAGKALPRVQNATWIRARGIRFEIDASTASYRANTEAMAL
jgi:hypothetical protein